MSEEIEVSYPSEDYLRAMYWQEVEAAKLDFLEDSNYAVLIARAANSVKKPKEQD